MSSAQGVLALEGNSGDLGKQGSEVDTLGGVRGSGAAEEDEPGTWETLVSPCERTGKRGAGNPSPNTAGVGEGMNAVAEPQGSAKKKKALAAR